MENNEDRPGMYCMLCILCGNLDRVCNVILGDHSESHMCQSRKGDCPGFIPSRRGV